MATSQKQIQANRQNSQISPGPRTPQGKARSSQNAITHGLTAQQVVIDGEDPEAFVLLRDELHAHYAPQSALEASFVELLAGHIWRALRIPVLEAAVLKALQQDEEHSRGERELSEEKFNCPRVSYHDDRELVEMQSSPEYLVPLRENERKRIAEYGQLAGLHIGHALIRDASRHDVMGKLERHELYLLNSIERIMRILDNRQGIVPGNPYKNVVDVAPDAA